MHSVNFFSGDFIRGFFFFLLFFPFFDVRLPVLEWPLTNGHG